MCPWLLKGPVALLVSSFPKGHDSTLGLSLNEGMPSESDCVLVQVLKLQGAVPFVHTNVPQSMLRLLPQAGLGLNSEVGGDGGQLLMRPRLTFSCFLQL